MWSRPVKFECHATNQSHCPARAARRHGQTLTDEEFKERQNQVFHRRVQQKVELFLDELKALSNNQLTSANRASAVNNLLELFLANGEDYYEAVNDSTSLRHGGVEIEIYTSAHHGRQRKKLKSYIYEIFNPNTQRSSKPYQPITVQRCDVIRIDNVQFVGDHYECMAYFVVEEFFGNHDEQPAYTDRTIRKCRIIARFNSGDVKLGDIYVVAVDKNSK